MITVPSLNNTSDILDTDMVMVTHSDGSTEKISGADLNKRNQVIFSANKTLTGTPLKAGNVVRVCFTQDITGRDTSSVLQLEYNGVNKNVKVNKDGTLIDFVVTEISSGVYKYVQAYTVLELLYDGTQFIIIGNPVVISDDGLKYYANGDHSADVVAVGNMHSVTSNAVAEKLNSFLVVIDSNSITASVSGWQAFSKSFSFTIPNEYKALCTVGFDVNGASGAVNLYSWYAFDVYGKTGTFTQNYYFKNYTSVDFNAVTLKMQLLCMKE